MELGTVQRVDIEDKLKSAYLDYAMSVITARILKRWRRVWKASRCIGLPAE